ncbi:hypothetical protein V8F33_001180 [Rhypophila sp. PSN 637]
MVKAIWADSNLVGLVLVGLFSRPGSCLSLPLSSLLLLFSRDRERRSGSRVHLTQTWIHICENKTSNMVFREMRGDESSNAVRELSSSVSVTT